MKKFIHGLLKIVISVMIILVLIGIVYSFYLAFKHRVKLGEEEIFLEPIGELVEVNGHNLHVYSEGSEDSEYTLIFMHGTGYVDSAITMSPLYDIMAEDYRIIYVDRSGNGYSEVSGVSRDIDTILEETKAAVDSTGAKGPYILVPQGNAIIEAMYWADLYPDEVKGIVGIDSGSLESYEDYKLDAGEKFSLQIMKFGCSQLGLHRKVDSIYTNDEYDLFTEKQEDVMNALVSAKAYNKDRYNEDVALSTNATKVLEKGYPDVEMLIFLANPLMDPYYSKSKQMQKSYSDYEKYKDEYNKARIDFFNEFDNIETKELAGFPALYIYEPEQMAEDINVFIDDLE